MRFFSYVDLTRVVIKGEGLSFSNEEKSKAHGGEAQINIGSIGQFAGNIGSQSSGHSSIQATQISAKLSKEPLFEGLRGQKTKFGY